MPGEELKEPSVERRAQALLELKDYRGAVDSFTDYLRKGGAPVPDVYRFDGTQEAKLLTCVVVRSHVLFEGVLDDRSIIRDRIK